MRGPVPARAADYVVRFLASIGRPAEAAQYVQLFQSEHPEQFAILHVSEAVLRDNLDALVADLRFLAELGLCPVIVIGVIGARGARRNADALAQAMLGAVPAQITTAARAGALAATRVVPIVPLLEDQDGDRDDDGRFDALADLARELGSRRLVFVTRRSGLQPVGNGRVVSMIDVRDEVATVGPTLPARQRALLEQIARMFDRVPQRFTVSVTSPLDLLRELFTVKGAGTMVRRGAQIRRFTDWAEVDVPALVRLVEDAFGVPLVTDFHQRPMLSTWVADDYRGAAVVTPTPLAPYLSKFAVTTVARGEGVGRDLWDPLVAAHPRLYWRSRAENPITSWYREQADGLQRIRIGEVAWVVLWRGLTGPEIADAIAYCQTAPADFLRA